ncbi:MAG: hypothetical protein ACRDRO_11665 [Pseudonocardiaceae bacterium]
MTRHIHRGPAAGQRHTARSMTRASAIPFPKEPMPSAKPADNSSGMPKTPTGTHKPINTDSERGAAMDWLDELGS